MPTLPPPVAALDAAFARSPRAGEETLHALASAGLSPADPDPAAVGDLETLAAAWRDATGPGPWREAATIVVRRWIESPGDSSLVETRDAAPRALLALGARLAALTGDTTAFGDAVVERLRLGPPCPDVLLAAARLGRRDALEDLRRVAATEPDLRHAATVALAWLDEGAALAELEREARDAADLLNDAVAGRGAAATHSTFHTLVEVLVHRQGLEVLGRIAARLRGQSPAKDRLLADYLAAVARDPALLPTPPAAEAVARAEAAIRAALG